MKKFILVILVLYSFSSLSASDKNRYDLLGISEDEENFLKRFGPIRIGISSSSFPFEYSENGELKGYAVDNVKKIMEIISHDYILVEKDNILDLIEAVDNREIDMLLLLNPYEERDKRLLYSEPYFNFARGFGYVNPGLINHHGQIFKHLRISYHEASISSRNFLKDLEVGTIVPIRGADDVKAGFENNELDMTFASLAALEVANYTHFDGKLIIEPFQNENSMIIDAHSFAVRDDWPHFVSILNKAIPWVLEEERNYILKKNTVFGEPEKFNFLFNKTTLLSEDDLSWIQNKNSLKCFLIDDMAPISYFTIDGEPRGIVYGYMEELQKRLGIPITYSGHNLSLEDGLKLLENNEVDFIANINQTPSRLKSHNFSDSYIELPLMIFSKKSRSFINNIRQLEHSRIVTVKENGLKEWLSGKISGERIKEVNSELEALDMINRGTADYFIGSALIARKIILEYHYNDIDIVGVTPYSYRMGVATVEEDAELASLLSKLLPIIKNDSGLLIENYWSNIDDKDSVDPFVYRVVFITLTLSFIFFAFQLRRHRRKEMILFEDSVKDPLTGLFNRRYLDMIFQEERERALQNDLKIMFFIFDIDHFKLYNDTYGHDVGDDALKAVSDALQAVFMRSNDFVFRLGGEEFGAFAIAKNEQVGISLGNRCLKQVKDLNIPHETSTNSDVVTISGGLVCRVADSYLTFNSLYKDADKKLYQAKDEGRNRFCY